MCVWVFVVFFFRENLEVELRVSSLRESSTIQFYLNFFYNRRRETRCDIYNAFITSISIVNGFFPTLSSEVLKAYSQAVIQFQPVCSKTLCNSPLRYEVGILLQLEKEMMAS